MKKILLLLLGAVLFSCASDDASDAPLSTEGTILKRIVMTTSDFVSTNNYKYDGEKLSKMTGGSSESATQGTVNYIYDGDLIVKYTTDFGASGHYEYDSSQRLIKMTENSANGNIIQTSFIYNADSSIDAATFDIINGSPVLKVNTTVYFQDGNMIRKTAHHATSGDHSYIYTYDEHPNPRVYAKGTEKLFFSWFSAENAASRNNIVKITEENDQTPEPVEVYHCVLTYNSNGYPVTEQAIKPDGSTWAAVSFYY